MVGGCPELNKIYDLLSEKHQLANKYYRIERGKLILDYKPVIKHFTAVFGKLAPTTPTLHPKASEAILNTLPALYACIAVHKKMTGELVNDIIIIEGTGGVGKSSLAAWVVKHVGGYFIHNANQLIDTIEMLISAGRWVPVIVIDDVASMISKYWYFEKKERAWANFFRMIEYAKDFAGVILITARSFEGVAKRLREIASLAGTMKTVYFKGGYLIGLIEYRRPGKRRVIYVDVYWPHLRMPKDIWDRMMHERRVHALEMLHKLKEQLTEKDEEEGENSE